MKSKIFVAALIAFAVAAQGAFAEEKKAEAKPAEKAADTKTKSEKGAEKGGKKLSDGEILKADTEKLSEAFKAKEIDKVLEHFSEKFTSSKLATKTDLKNLLEMAMNSGYLDGLTIESKDLKITVEGEKATIGPMSLSGGFGTAVNTYHCTKEDGAWKITGMDLTGVEF